MKIFVTGASGSLGTQLLKCLENDIGIAKITCLTRNEHKLKKFKGRKKLKGVIGDVRDRVAMGKLARGHDVIFHLAALKHVDLMEEFKHECMQTNLEGTKNIIAAQKSNNVKKLVFVSTDKAVLPINTYGLCKALSERLVLENPKNVVCRYGNVFGSNGSVFQYLPQQLKETNTIKITDYEMTRFWITVKEAAKFVYTEGMRNQGVCIPKMKSAEVYKMMQLKAKMEGHSKYKVEEIGLRAGEKIHEHITETLTSENAERYTDLELMELLK